MRAEIVAEIPNLEDKFLAGVSGPIGKVSESQALAGFCAAVRGKDSFFHLQDSIAGFAGPSSKAHGAYIGQFRIAFRRLDLSGDRNLYFTLLKTLHELLERTSASDALFATMCVTAPATDQSNGGEPALVLQLEAVGVTPEQAELRWGLGLAHVQEALLCASRLMREHLAPTKIRLNSDLPSAW
jgi:hypothetical protein